MLKRVQAIIITVGKVIYQKAKRQAIRLKSQQVVAKCVLCNQKGGILDHAWELIIGALAAVLIWAAASGLFSNTIMPKVTGLTSSLFS